MKRMMSDQRAAGLLISMTLAGVLVVGLMGSWWPGIYLALGIPLAIRSFVRGKAYDGVVFLVIFGLGWITATWVENYGFIFPTVLSIAAIYTLCRDVFGLDPEEADERKEELEVEIQEERDQGASSSDRPL